MKWDQNTYAERSNKRSVAKRKQREGRKWNHLMRRKLIGGGLKVLEARKLEPPVAVGRAIEEVIWVLALVVFNRKRRIRYASQLPSLSVLGFNSRKTKKLKKKGIRVPTSLSKDHALPHSLFVYARRPRRGKVRRGERDLKRKRNYCEQRWLKWRPRKSTRLEEKIEGRRSDEKYKWQKEKI